jgi:hypothetical protein
MRPISFAFIFGLTCVGLGAAVPAQSGMQLGQRPISRGEVIAFVKRQFAQMDRNHDGFVSPAEFQTYRAAQPKGGGAQIGRITKHWFERADGNRDGRVTVVEAQARPLRFFGMADLNKDGVASIREQSVAKFFMGG